MLKYVYIIFNIFLNFFWSLDHRYKKRYTKFCRYLQSAYSVWSTALGSGVKWNSEQNKTVSMHVQFMFWEKKTSLKTHVYSTHVCVCMSSGIMRWLSRTRNKDRQWEGCFVFGHEEGLLSQDGFWTKTSRKHCVEEGHSEGGNKCKCSEASALGCGITLQAMEAVCWWPR